MKTSQVNLTHKNISEKDVSNIQAINPNWVTVFGHPSYFEKGDLGIQLRKLFPQAEIIGCSTAGEISTLGVFDQRLVITGVHFKTPYLKADWCQIGGLENSKNSGKKLSGQFKTEKLNSFFVLSQGVEVNGSDLISGLRENLPVNTVVVGGLAGDAGEFKKTYVLCNEKVGSDITAGIAFYGNHVQVGFGSVGGWEPFGPVRHVTKAKGNVLYTLDGESALSLYKKYLGDHAKQLPASGLLFPFAILKENGDQTGLIRTILGVDEKEGSLIFAGDIPNNSIVRLMNAKNGNLVQGALKAAESALSSHHSNKSEDSLAILVSCVGRKLVLADDIDDEVDAVRSVIPKGSITGFYSYGEICPFENTVDCKLHNQTMTISYFTESEK